MTGDAQVFAVVVRQIVQIVRVRAHIEEILEVDRQTGVERVALHMDDARARKRGVDQSGVQEVRGHLVRDPQRCARARTDSIQVFARHARHRLRRVARRAAPGFANVANARSQKRTSPAPNTLGCEARICSVSEVPDRGMPIMNTGSSESQDAGRASCANAAAAHADDPVDQLRQLGHGRNSRRSAW